MAARRGSKNKVAPVTEMVRLHGSSKSRASFDGLRIDGDSDINDRLLPGQDARGERYMLPAGRARIDSVEEEDSKDALNQVDLGTRTAHSQSVSTLPSGKSVGFRRARTSSMERSGNPTDSELAITPSPGETPAPGERERRRSSVVASKRSKEAAAKLANSWGSKNMVKKNLARYQGKRCVLSPGSRFMRWWDTLTLVCLVLVAAVTPVEVAFLSTTFGDPLFIANRLVDLIFMIDIVFTFFLEYRDTETSLWIYNHRQIAKRYLTSWFLIDFVSVLPFDLTSLMLQSDAVQSLQIVRITRVAKLAKLARVMRVARISRRWQRDLAIPFATLALAKFGLYMLIMTHWFACIWGLVGTVQTSGAESTQGFVEEGTSWLQAFGFHGKPVIEIYLASVHWAMQTVSTIGYGDITPVTMPERFVAAFCMAYGASVWTYVVASVCGIVTSLDPHGTHRKHTIAEVNEFMQNKRLKKSWRPRLRSFFLSRESYHRSLSSRRLLRLMSPTLRADVSRHINAVWLHRVPYLRSVSQGFITEISMVLEQEFWAPEEVINSRCLHILEKGVCLQASRVIPMGFVWGQDMILDNPLLRNTQTVYTLAHTQLLKCERATFFHVLSFFPQDRKIIAAAANWITVRRKITMWMRSIKENGEDPAEGIRSRIHANHMAKHRLFRTPPTTSLGALGGVDYDAKELLYKL